MKKLFLVSIIMSLLFLVSCQGSKPLMKDYTIHDAVKEGDIDTVTSFIEDGGDVNIIEKHTGNTLIYLATITGNFEMIKLLIEQSGQSVDIDMKNRHGDSPVLAATIGTFTKEHVKYEKILEYLIKNGGSFSTKNNDGVWTLDVAVKGYNGKYNPRTSEILGIDKNEQSYVEKKGLSILGEDDDIDEDPNNYNVVTKKTRIRELGIDFVKTYYVRYKGKEKYFREDENGVFYYGSVSKRYNSYDEVLKVVLDDLGYIKIKIFIKP